MAKHSLTDIYVPVRWHLLLDWVCPYLGKRICSLQSHAWFLNRIMSYKLAKSIVYIEYISFLTKVVQSYHLFPINSYISYLHFSVSSSCFQYSQLIPFFSCHSLFHVVVESDDISTQIIRHLTSEKGGRVTFIPLNRVKVSDTNYPQSPDVVPLLKKLKYRAEYSHAFKQVLFSRD